MLFELYELPISVQTSHILLGMALGLIFGIAAQISRFCLRRGLIAAPDAKTARATWLTALLAAILTTQILMAAGWIDLSDHRFFASELPIAAILIGGVAFGAGMVLTRGCVSRLTVLGATGNLRALFGLILFAVVAHATLKGVLAPLRTSLGDFTVDLGITSLTSLPGGTAFWPAAITVTLAAYILYRRPAVTHMVLAGVIGVLVATGWAGTSLILQDSFDPLPAQSLAFTAPWTDTLFWVIASSAIPAGFGTGLIAGVLGGSFVSAALRSELKLVTFETPIQTLRYGAGAALMGFGGVLAGGCSVGAGLSGVGTLSIAAILALVAIALGALATDRALNAAPSPAHA